MKISHAIKFTLSGNTAFFKNPDINTCNSSDTGFSFLHIHPIALLGILGSITGASGYAGQKKSMYPGFYEKGRNLKMSIIPSSYKYKTKLHKFSNSTGFNNQSELGPANFIWTEQWLENINYDIFILDDESEYFNQIKTNLENNISVFPIYFGSNKHFANISNYEYVELSEVNSAASVNSMIMETESLSIFDTETRQKEEFYKIFLPYKFNTSNNYVLKSFILTNKKIDVKDNTIYSCKNKNILFY